MGVFQGMENKTSLSKCKLIQFSTYGRRCLLQMDDLLGGRLKFMAPTGILGGKTSPCKVGIYLAEFVNYVIIAKITGFICYLLAHTIRF